MSGFLIFGATCTFDGHLFAFVLCLMDEGFDIDHKGLDINPPCSRGELNKQLSILLKYELSLPKQ